MAIGHGASRWTESERYRRTKAMETEIMRRAAGVVTLSETMSADILAPWRGRPGARSWSSPTPSTSSGSSPGSTRRDAGADSLGIEPDETVVGYIST